MKFYTFAVLLFVATAASAVTVLIGQNDTRALRHENAELRAQLIRLDPKAALCGREVVCG